MSPAAARRVEEAVGGEREEGEPEGKKRQGGEAAPLLLPPALHLPAHVISRVFLQLDCVDLLHCSLVCKQWYRDSAELREGWKNEYIEAWNFYGLNIRRETHPPSSTCSIRGVHSWCP
ncbi:hypothetical protein Taro_023362 [Colocasia esculenta]|uniref:F-box domain-containing protein n=1 Tax=Colocasia esculenta TaxID=4460 RepID=A0A843VH53_COLES|nr:hypothetical protein [Colocasia esculenta]